MFRVCFRPHSKSSALKKNSICDETCVGLFCIPELILALFIDVYTGHGKSCDPLLLLGRKRKAVRHPSRNWFNVPYSIWGQRLNATEYSLKHYTSCHLNYVNVFI